LGGALARATPGAIGHDRAAAVALAAMKSSIASFIWSSSQALLALDLGLRHAVTSARIILAPTRAFRLRARG
jgi:hypothetical protein